MKLSRFFLMIVVALLPVVVFSCKDDDDEEGTSFYFDGTLEFDIPAYIVPGEVYTLVPGGCTRNEDDGTADGDFGYYWTITPESLGLATKDTVKVEGEGDSNDGSFVLTVPDTLCTITISCYIFAEGYYNSSCTSYATIVDPAHNGSLTGLDWERDSETDPRDGKALYFFEMNGLKWMVHNLAYAGCGVPYYECEAMEDIYGMFYTWDEAVNACPPGWRLPTIEDFEDLCSNYTSSSVRLEALEGAAGSLMADAYFNQEKMWEYWPAVKITNISGFNCIPTGFATIDSNGYSFSGVSKYSVYWLGDEGGDETAACVHFYEGNPDVLLGELSKTNFATTVRCVADQDISEITLSI